MNVVEFYNKVFIKAVKPFIEYIKSGYKSEKKIISPVIQALSTKSPLRTSVINSVIAQRA